jgi:hypothetical protein
MKIEDFNKVGNLIYEFQKQQKLLDWIDEQKVRLNYLDSSSNEYDIESINNLSLGVKLFMNNHPTPTWEKSVNVDKNMVFEMLDIIKKKTEQRKESLEIRIRELGVEI